MDKVSAAKAALNKCASLNESYTSLSTEELVKIALQKMMSKSNPDEILNGIKKKASTDQQVAAAAYVLIKSANSENDPVVDELEKRAFVGLAMRALPWLGRMAMRAGTWAMPRLAGKLTRLTGAIKALRSPGATFMEKNIAAPFMRGIRQVSGANANAARKALSEAEALTAGKVVAPPVISSAVRPVMPGTANSAGTMLGQRFSGTANRVGTSTVPVVQPTSAPVGTVASKLGAGSPSTLSKTVAPVAAPAAKAVAPTAAVATEAAAPVIGETAGSVIPAAASNGSWTGRLLFGDPAGTKWQKAKTLGSRALNTGFGLMMGNEALEATGLKNTRATNDARDQAAAMIPYFQQFGNEKHKALAAMIQEKMKAGTLTPADAELLQLAMQNSGIFGAEQAQTEQQTAAPSLSELANAMFGA